MGISTFGRRIAVGVAALAGGIALTAGGIALANEGGAGSRNPAAVAERNADAPASAPGDDRNCPWRGDGGGSGEGQATQNL